MTIADSRLRIVFFGHVAYSRSVLHHLRASPLVDLVGIVTRNPGGMHADGCSLADVAASVGIPVFMADGATDRECADWIRSLRADVAFAIGWATLLGPLVLAAPRLGIVGYHPALLPRNRGHHPIVWALALGLRETGSTLFFLDEGIDTGDIISQVHVPIAPDDDAGTLYERLTATVAAQVVDAVERLAAGRIERRPQDHAFASVWRRRGERDGEIDWRMTAESVHNLVRALTRPYVGAHVVFRGHKVKIWKTALCGDGSTPTDLEPGRVLRVDGRSLVVRCGSGALQILEHEFDPLPPAGRCIR